jgi:hypothetical protein
VHAQQDASHAANENNNQNLILCIKQNNAHA